MSWDQWACGIENLQGASLGSHIPKRSGDVSKVWRKRGNMRQPHELLVDKFWLCHNSNLEVSAPINGLTLRVKGLPPAWKRSWVEGGRPHGRRQGNMFCFMGSQLGPGKKTHTHAEHSIAILQVRNAEAQGWNPTRANYMNRATRVCKMVAAHLKASKLTSMNSGFLSCTQLEIIAQSEFQVPVTLG